MKAVKLNKKLWTDTTVEELSAVMPASCNRPLLEGCGCSGCGCCGCCCAFYCWAMFCP